MAIPNHLSRVVRVITSDPDVAARARELVPSGIQGLRNRRGALIGAATVAAGVQGFSSGVNSRMGDVSSAVYEMTTGDPNIDEYVFGTDVGIRELMLPLPDITPNLGIMDNMFGENAMNLWRNRRFLTPQMIGRTGSAQRSGYFENRMPTVNGSAVFGMREARNGY